MRGFFFSVGAGVIITASCANGGDNSLTLSTSTGARGTGNASGAGGTTLTSSGGGSGTVGNCSSCVTTANCGAGYLCGQFAGDSYCALDCTQGESCPAGYACTPFSTVEGNPASGCVPVTNSCSISSTTTTSGASTSSGGTTTTTTTSSSSAGGTTCGVLVGPSVQASCTSCQTQGKTCQANGCYGGWWCNTMSSACQPPPGNCGSTSTSSSSSSTSGGSCAHSPCTSGTKLTQGCDPCVATVCAQDSYCCSNKWDSQCVTEGSSACSCTSTSSSSSSSTTTTSSSSSSATTSASSSSGGTGTVGPGGGSLYVLNFAVVGDTRPAVDNDTSGYPTAVITQIWKDVQAQSPAFTISTGDYMFATPSSGQAAPQLDLYLGARSNYTGVQFPAMGNHECTGATASNCGPGTTDGVTDNYTQFMNKMLAPLGVTEPYYVIDVNSTSNAWTAKFVFVAANAWTQTQASWLTSVLSKPTTYTFVVRHESITANTAPGVTPSEQIISAHPLTLRIVGHAHTYQYTSGSGEVIIGNGGAPLAGGANYGYVIARQRVSDGAMIFTEYDYATNAANATFAVKPDGTPTQ